MKIRCLSVSTAVYMVLSFQLWITITLEVVSLLVSLYACVCVCVLVTMQCHIALSPTKDAFGLPNSSDTVAANYHFVSLLIISGPWIFRNVAKK